MTENEWTQSICEQLNVFLNNKTIYANTLIKVPYSQEIIGYSEDWVPEYMMPARFETDMVIYETSGMKLIPRVIIESKLKNVTTHDAITYSYKAEKHKNITPYLRYGIILGERGNYPLPGRLFRHGTNFDFMFSFAETKPTEEEWKTFTRMLLKEVEYSRIMEEALHESRNKNRKNYYMLQKQLVLKQIK